MCIPTFQKSKRHDEGRGVVIVFGHSCLQDVDTRSFLSSFLTTESLAIYLKYVEVKSFWFDILYVHNTILGFVEPSSIEKCEFIVTRIFVSIFEKYWA